MTVTPTATTHLPPHPTAPATTVPWTDLLAAATDDCLAALLKGADQDWSRPAHALDWTCRQTLDHLALGLMGYTGLLIARPDDRYITLFASLDPQAPIPACLDGLRIAASSSPPPSATRPPKHVPGTRGVTPTPPVSPPWGSPNWPSTPTTSPAPSACPGPRPQWPSAAGGS